MEQPDRHLATVHVTLEPTMQDDGQRRVAEPSQFAIWIAIGDKMELYGLTRTRMEAAVLVREISNTLGVSRTVEV